MPLFFPSEELTKLIGNIFKCSIFFPSKLGVRLGEIAIYHKPNRGESRLDINELKSKDLELLALFFSAFFFFLLR